MTDQDAMLTQMMKEITKIGVKQETLLDDIAEIKENLKEMRADNCKRDEKINNLEIHQANEDGQHKVTVGLLSVAAAFISALVTSFIARLWG